MDRREARKQAFNIIFQYKFQPDATDIALDEFFAENDAGIQEDYIRSAVVGTVGHIDEIDDKIGEYVKDRAIDRIDSVSLAAMRLGVYEMLYIESIPLAVSVNEAVNLTREFSGPELVGFVNGVLGGIQKSLQSAAQNNNAE